MRVFLRIVFLLSVMTYAASLFQVNRLPAKEAIVPELYREPVQVPIDLPPFTITRRSITYTITPSHAYELYGLVVTWHHSGSLIDISHGAWKDYLNAKDISVIWGNNIAANDYHKVTFSHGDWTGYYRYKEAVNFSAVQFANNHLITDNPRLEKEIMRTRTGDQVFVVGYLAQYSHSNGAFTRGTSTTRDDTGNGACETIFVTDYAILQQANPAWRQAQRLALLLGVLSAAGVVAGSIAAFMAPVA
jgi:hypothetical protein